MQINFLQCIMHNPCRFVCLNEKLKLGEQNSWNTNVVYSVDWISNFYQDCDPVIEIEVSCLPDISIGKYYLFQFIHA